MERKRVGLEDVLSTYSSHIEKSYPEPAAFQKNLDVLLSDKNSRMESGAYLISVEKNIVFLSDLITEGEALIDLLVNPSEGDLDEGLEIFLGRMESRARAHTDERYREIFIDENDERFAELRALKQKSEKPYRERLEFDYRYLMTFRIMLFEFINVLETVRSKYSMAFDKKGAVKKIIDRVTLTTNFYLGNVTVEEGGAGGKEGRH